MLMAPEWSVPNMYPGRKYRKGSVKPRLRLKLNAVKLIYIQLLFTIPSIYKVVANYAFRRHI